MRLADALVLSFCSVSFCPGTKSRLFTHRQTYRWKSDTHHDCDGQKDEQTDKTTSQVHRFVKNPIYFNDLTYYIHFIFAIKQPNKTIKL